MYLVIACLPLLGRWLARSSLDILTKLGGEWVWFHGYRSRSISHKVKPCFTCQELMFTCFGMFGQESLPNQIFKFGMCIYKEDE